MYHSFVAGKIEGFLSEVNSKPFNVKVLIARCNNLIKNKKRLIAHYAGKTITESPVTEAINERDNEREQVRTIAE